MHHDWWVIIAEVEMYTLCCDGFVEADLVGFFASDTGGSCRRSFLVVSEISDTRLAFDGSVFGGCECIIPDSLSRRSRTTDTFPLR